MLFAATFCKFSVGFSLRHSSEAVPSHREGLCNCCHCWDRCDSPHSTLGHHEYELERCGCSQALIFNTVLLNQITGGIRVFHMTVGQLHVVSRGSFSCDTTTFWLSRSSFLMLLQLQNR